MSIYGALGEAPAGNNASRKGEIVANGTAVITGNGTVTLPIAMRTVTNVILTLTGISSTGLAANAFTATVGAITNNTFTIFVWELDGSAADAAASVNWVAFGKLA
jgi:hypothetical protein